MSVKKSMTPEMIAEDIKAYKERKKSEDPRPRVVHSAEELIKVVKELKRGEFIVWRDILPDAKDYYESEFTYRLAVCEFHDRCRSADKLCLTCRHRPKTFLKPNITSPAFPGYTYVKSGVSSVTSPRQ